MTRTVQSEYAALPDEVKWDLQRADGFIDLKLYARAHESLDSIPEPHRDSLPYLLHRLRLLMAEEAWESARQLALATRDALPGEALVWIQLAYATRRASSIEQAQAILVEAEAAFPGDALIRYNLACYACCRSEQKRAKDYLQEAFKRDASMRSMAMEDPDLEPLWDEVETL